MMVSAPDRSSTKQNLNKSGHNGFFIFYLDAAWLNEGRCPGGRPSVSEHKG